MSSGSRTLVGTMTDGDRRLLPPMAMLASFEMAARHASISRAADSLSLTQSAVSRQIAHLEEWLGVTLFDRVGRRIVLNARGRAYLTEIAPALAQIRRATAPLVHPAAGQVIALATLPSFGMRWLAPRLPRLTARHGEMVVNINARIDIFDLEREGFDAAIHVGNADWPGAEHDFLFREQVVPVVAPRLLDSLPGGLRGPADLMRLPLLLQSERRDAWERWYAHIGLDVVVPAAQASFPHFLMLAQAVSAGAGVALMPSFLIREELASGALVAPFDIAMGEARTYYLVWPRARAANPAFGQFRQWILDEAAIEA